jgi:outer membrane protein TolC
MIKKIFLATFVIVTLNASSFNELFKALKENPITKIDEVSVKKAKTNKEIATSSLYPTLNLFGSYDNYSSPNSMLPVPPNTVLHLVKNPSEPQPFSRNIYRGGVNFSMPLFVKSIYTTTKKMEYFKKSLKDKKRLNLLKNEAIIVGSDANLLYLEAMKESLDLKEKSLQETLKTLKIKVDSGRTPQSALYKIDDNLNQIKIAKNNIKIQKQQILGTIKKLTGIELKKALDINNFEVKKSSQYLAIKIANNQLQASNLTIKAQKEQLYPKVLAHGNYVFSRAKAYNNDKNINEHFGNIGVVVDIPIFDKKDFSQIKKAKLQYTQAKLESEKLQNELDSKAQTLQQTIPLLENSLKLYKKSIENKENLLKIAKISYQNDRLTTEEYLRYEDDVVSAKAKYFKAKTKLIQAKLELAVLYGDNIEEMIK